MIGMTGIKAHSRSPTGAGDLYSSKPPEVKNIYEYLAQILTGRSWIELENAKIDDGVVMFDVLPAKKLLEIAKMLPKENLEDRQNNAPKFAEFLKIAEEVPRALFGGYVVYGRRKDKRMTIDTIYLPKTEKKIIRRLLRYKPDLYEKFDEYVMMYWD